MTSLTPVATIRDGNLRICFSDAQSSQSVQIDCVIDLTDFGDILGIEVLDWQRQLSGASIAIPSPDDTTKLNWTYDDEIDALYITLKRGYSQVQKPTKCKVGMDAHKHVVYLELSIPQPPLR
jgi:uncharacterized protein YuzE